MRVTERVAKLLADKNIQQKELAEKINYTKSTLSYTLSKNRDFSADDVIGISQCLGVSVHYLLTGEEENTFIQAETPSPKLSEDEAELLNIYRSIDREGKTSILYNAYQQRSRFRNDSEQKIKEDHIA